MIKRHVPLAVTAGTLIGATLTGADKLNILAIFVDQLSAQVMSNAGCGWVKTPALDRLAREGVKFDNACCSFPLCTPVRASLLTGQRPFKAYPDPLKFTSIGKIMADNGYTTAYVGKWHVGKTLLENQKTAAWSGFEFRKPMETDPDIEKTAIRYLRTKRRKPFFLITSFVNPHDCCELARKIGGWKDKKSISFHKGGLTPDLNVPQIETPPLPDNFAVNRLLPEVMRSQTPAPGDNKISLRPTGSWGENEWRLYRYGYAKLVENVDARIGRILNTLDKLKLTENTVVIFMSDHGDGIGAHAWNQKHAFYEEIIRVPLIIRAPGAKKNMQCNVPVNTGIDFLPTVADFAGIACKGYPGISLKNVVYGGRVRERNYIVGEFMRNAQGIGLAGHPQDAEFKRIKKYADAEARFVRTKHWKYVIYNQGKNPEMLFDLKNDPGELHNSINAPDSPGILQKMRQYLRQYKQQSGDPF